MKRVTLEVNGKKIDKEIPDHTILSVLLRDILNLTGTHIGCDTSQCGACVVHVEGKSIKSCTAFAAETWWNNTEPTATELFTGPGVSNGSTQNNQGFEIQFKGSGKTKFSRDGDGKAALGPLAIIDS